MRELGAALLVLFGGEGSLDDARTVVWWVMNKRVDWARLCLLSALVADETESGRLDGALALLRVMFIDFDSPTTLRASFEGRHAVVEVASPIGLMLFQSRVTWHRHFTRQSDGVWLSCGLTPLVEVFGKLWRADLDLAYRIDLSEGEEY